MDRTRQLISGLKLSATASRPFVCESSLRVFALRAFNGILESKLEAGMHLYDKVVC